MAKARRIEIDLRAAEALRHQPVGADLDAGVRKALGHASGIIIAPAARAVLAAARGLRLYRDRAAIVERVEAIVRQRRDARVLAVW